jgi:hypothetical protein
VVIEDSLTQLGNVQPLTGGVGMGGITVYCRGDSV